MFQRHYVWSETNQWQPLWDDIIEKLAARQEGKKLSAHFLGAVILDAVRNTSARQVTRFLVIDGQQRLTTFQLLLAALRDVSRQREANHVANPIERCLFNADIERMEEPEASKFKLWPTLMNREAYRQVITAESPERVRELYPVIRIGRKRNPEPRDKFAEAYEFFHHKINGLCTNCPTVEAVGDLLAELYGVLRQDFTIVEIVLSEEDDAQEIFNSLNARGKPLSQSDLLRSYIFMRVEKGNLDRDRLYQTYWSRFENAWWDAEVGRGSQNSSRLDTLTRALLSAKIGNSIDVRRVHAAYVEWINKEKPYQKLEDELREFQEYGISYEQLLGTVGGRLTEFGRRMRIWDTTTVYPLALFLAVEGKLPDTELDETLNLLESFVVRRAVCHLDNNAYNNYFVEIVSRLRKTEVSLSNFNEILASGEGYTRRFPQDSEFAKAWVAEPLYGRLSSSQIALMLQQLELAIRSQRAEVVPIPTISVEHILPQRWTTHYPLNGEMVSQKMDTDYLWLGSLGSLEEKAQYERLKAQIAHRRKSLHTMGNLTAVTKPLNSALSNGKFLDKKKGLSESILALNRYFDAIEVWDEEAIQTRSEKLFAYAQTIWKMPALPLHNSPSPAQTTV